MLRSCGSGRRCGRGSATTLSRCGRGCAALCGSFFGLLVMMVMGRMMCAGHRLRRDRLSAISRRFRIAGRLLDTAGRRLGLRRRLLRLGSSSFRARSRLIGAIGRVDGTLGRVRAGRSAPCRKRKGQCSPGSKYDKFRGFPD